MKKLKKILVVFIIVVLVLSVMPIGFVSLATSEFAGGDGTEENPYLISNTTQLNNVRNHLNSHFKLTNDIKFTKVDFDEGGAFYNKGKGFVPIGSSNDAFTGIFNGNGFVIKNLYINCNSQFAGLFGYSKGSIKNLGMIDCEILSLHSSASYSYSYSGGIVGINSYGTIINCYNSGSSFSSSAAAYTSHSYAGGIVGKNNSGTVTNCCNTSSISASASANRNFSYSGGIIGYNDSGTVTNCYNTGSVLASASYSYSGGIVGKNNSGTVTNCYNIGSISSSSALSPHRGGISAENYLGTIINCYYLNTCVTYPTYTQGIALTDSQMTLQESFIDFDFKNIWSIKSNDTYKYPQLITLLNRITENYYIYESPINNLSDDDAIDFIGFLLNSNEISNAENIETVKQSELFRLLTGRYVGNDIIEKSIAYSGIIKLTAAKYSNKYDEICKVFRQDITDYLDDYVPKTGVGIAEDAFEENKEYVMRKFYNILSDCVKSVCNLSDTVGGIYVDITFDSFENLNLAISNIKEYTSYICAAIDGVFLAYSEEMAGRYGYFIEYIEFRPNGGPSDHAVSAAYDALRLSYKDKYMWAGFLDLLSFFTHKESFLDNFDTLDRWAECIYLMSTIKANPATCNHNYITAESKDATCTADGKNVMICGICNHINTENIPKKNHNYTVSNKVSATCNQNGYIEYICYGCNYSYTQTFNSTGHSISAIENEDYTLYKCDNCDYSYQNIKEHTHSYTQNIVEADCENYGYTINKCECGDSYTNNYTEPKGHNYSEGLTTESTCLTTGTVEHICSYCGDTLTYELPLKGHRYINNYLEPTCHSEGKLIYTCTDCEYAFEEIVSETIGHQYSNYSSYNENCVNHTVGICSNCDAEKETVTPNHNYNDTDIPASYTNPKIKIKICKDCEYKTQATYGVALADFNSDGVINQADYTAFDTSTADPTLFDFDKNGVIDNDFDSVIIKNLTNNIDLPGIIDINDDGESDVRDLIRAKKILTEAEPEKSDNGNADRNLDGETDAKDIAFISKFILDVDLKHYAQ